MKRHPGNADVPVGTISPSHTGDTAAESPLAKTKAARTAALPALTPKLRFPEFRGAPAWHKTRLSSVLTEHEEKNDGASEVHSVSVHKGVINQVEHLGRSFASTDRSNYNLAKPYDIIYTKSPTGDFPYGIVKQSRLPYNVIVSPLYGVFSPANRYLGYIFDAYFESPIRTSAYLAPITQKGAKNTIQISNATFLSKGLYLPDQEAEQQKIAECLGSLDELIATENRKLDALKAHKKGLMQQLFPRPGESTPRLRFPEFQDAKAWEVKPFDEFVAKSFYGTSSSTSSHGKYPVLRMGNMADGGLDFTNLVYIDLDRESFESFRLEEGDLLLNRTNSPALVGKISLFRLKSECLTASYIVTYRLKKERLDPTFCNFMLNTPLYQTQIRTLAKPSISQANINPTTFRKEILVSVPAPAEQHRIANCLTTLDSQITAQTTRLATLRTHKQGLMQQLFPSACTEEGV